MTRKRVKMLTRVKMIPATRPVRIQRRRVKGWRLPPNTVCVDRRTQWGNPFKVDDEHDAAACVESFRAYVLGRIRSGQGYPLAALRGKSIACWCKPGAPCHGDVLLELAGRLGDDLVLRDA